MTKPIHILNQLGVLASFSVAKRITEEEIKTFFSKQKRKGKSDREISDMMHTKIIDDIQEAILKNEIPGLLSSQEVAKDLGMDQAVIDKMPELNRLVMILSNKLSEKKYDKQALCYFINSLVNVLGLTEKDFERFHQNNREDDDEDQFED